MLKSACQLQGEVQATPLSLLNTEEDAIYGIMEVLAHLTMANCLCLSIKSSPRLNYCVYLKILAGVVCTMLMNVKPVTWSLGWLPLQRPPYGSLHSVEVFQVDVTAKPPLNEADILKTPSSLLAMDTSNQRDAGIAKSCLIAGQDSLRRDHSIVLAVVSTLKLLPKHKVPVEELSLKIIQISRS